eukprot:5474652-Pleurochrysis_carterae.AAC.1
MLADTEIAAVAAAVQCSLRSLPNMVRTDSVLRRQISRHSKRSSTRPTRSIAVATSFACHFRAEKRLTRKSTSSLRA